MLFVLGILPRVRVSRELHVHPECYYFHAAIQDAGGLEAPAELIRDNPGHRDRAIEKALKVKCKYCGRNGASAKVQWPPSDPERPAMHHRKHLYTVHLNCAKAHGHTVTRDSGRQQPHAREVHPLDADEPAEKVGAADNEEKDRVSGQPRPLKRKLGSMRIV